VILSWVTIREPSRLILSELKHKGILASNNLAQYSRAGLLVKDREFLKDLLVSVKRTDPDILSAAFYGRDDEVLAATDPDHPSPLRFSVASLKGIQVKRSSDMMAIVNPVRDELGRALGATVVVLSDRRVEEVVRKSAGLMVLSTLGFFFGVFIILNFLIKEALKASELELAYDHLQRLQEQLVKSERMAAIGQLAASVAHEIRTPLGGIQNAVYYVRDSLKGAPVFASDPGIGDMLDLVEDEIRVSTRIINELLDFSKPVILKKRPVPVEGLFRSSLASLSVPGNIKTSFKPSPGAEDLVCDAERMRQVFQNLMLNAIQAMPEGGELAVSARLEQPYLCVDFKDNGTGIAPENMDKLFEPLFSTKAKGTGLGLPISKEIVEKHGGVIEAASVRGKGSAFTVKLPLDPEKRSG